MEVLTSNIIFGCAYVDSNLINPYGIVVDGCYIWVSSTTSSLVIKYNMKGKPVSTVSVMSPTGMCMGKCGVLYVASNDGSIYSIAKGSTTATLVAAIERTPPLIGGLAYSHGTLYVSVPSFGYVQVHDATVSPPKEVLGLTDDSTAPFNYVPIGLTIKDKMLYITYGDGTTAQGFGYVNRYKLEHGHKRGHGSESEHGRKYDHECDEMNRLINRGFLARPYSTAVYNNNLYIANGNGYIQIYSLNGEYIRRFNVDGDVPFFSDGLRSITVHDDKLYYVAATNNGMMGNLGVVHL